MKIEPIAPATFETNMRQGNKIDKNGATQLIFELRGNNLFLCDAYLKSTSQYYKFMSRPKGIDELINQAESAKDEAARLDGMHQIVKLVYDTEPFIPMWAQPRIMVTDNKVQNTGFMITSDPMNQKPGFTSWLNK